MKIVVDFRLTKTELCQDYSPAFVSFLKNALSNYDMQLYEKIYENKNKNEKNFCFAIRLHQPKFENSKVLLQDNLVKMIIHTADMIEGIDFYNAILLQKGIDYPFPNGNSAVVEKVRIENHKTIASNEILIKMLSPLIVRKHEDGKDYYMSYEEEEFNKYFAKSVSILLKNTFDFEVAEDSVKIEPVKARKTVVNTFKNKITANVGIFRLKGDLQILNLLYTLGIGGRRSQGYGCFEVVSEVK